MWDIIKDLRPIHMLMVLSLSILGCASTPVEKIIYKTTPLILPTAPTLPVWKSTDMQCLSTEVKQKMLDRDRLRKEYTEQLQSVIKSTH